MPEYYKKPSSACPGGACEGCADPMCMSDGGEVQDTGPAIDPDKAKQMETGATTSGWQPGEWKKNLKEGLGMAEGGEVDGPEVDDEIHNMLGEELMSAFESKDRKRVMEGLEALVMSCMNKRGEPDA